MTVFRKSLAARLFVSMAATTVLVVAIMTLLVALSMRDGFDRFLLRGELSRFDALEQALVLAYDPATLGWPELAGQGQEQRWADFMLANAGPANAGPADGAGFGPLNPPLGPPPGPPPGPRRAGDTMRFEQRLALLAADGTRLAGFTDPSGLVERRAICVQDDCNSGLLGYIALTAPAIPGDASARFFLRGQYWALALAALTAVLVSALAAYAVSRRLLVPIRQLAAGAKSMALGNYTARITHVRLDELGQLIGHYNALAAALERTDKAEREWISNTSHELQTPLAVLRAQIEAVQDGVRQPDAETLAAMHAAMMRLSRLVQDIKTLSYDREGALDLSPSTEDLGIIVRRSAQAMLHRFAANGIVLDLEIPDRMPLVCDPARIGQVVDNLLANAARYTAAPGQVKVRVTQGDGTAILSIDDTPPGPLPDDLPRLFDRFFRAETSRSRVTGGAGLGLSVCRAIVTAHGGTITAEHSDLGGLRVIVSLPKGTP